jgi:hypothetical protein
MAPVAPAGRGLIAGAQSRIDRAMDVAIARESESLQKGLGVLASVGSVTPFVGLFGTVWGIMNSFIGIAQEQNTNLAVVAPGIAEALLATGWGSRRHPGGDLLQQAVDGRQPHRGRLRGLRGRVLDHPVPPARRGRPEMGAGVMKQDGAGEHRRRRSRGRNQPMAEINITPFVDVMLVLLIIFMVAAPLMTVGVAVELPQTAAQALPMDEEEP